MGAVSGLGLGPTVCIGFMYINGWAGKNSGLLIGTATSAPTILSIAQNQIITAYVNPKNLKADTLIGVRAYFSQREILERVPEIILILGCMGLGLQIIGYLLITNPPTASDPTLNGKDNDVEKHPENGKENISQNISDPKSLLVNRNEPAKHYDANSIKDDNEKTSAISDREIFQENNQTNHVESHSKYHNVRSLKPSETLRSSNFYAMWLYGAAVGFGLILKNNYYKQFGLIYINNDVFLTLVGSLIPVFASATRIILGACIDRDILSIQDCLVMSLAANTFLCAFWFFAPQVSAILYMVLILALACAHSMVHTIVGTGVSKLFGNEHYFLNYGLVYSSGFLIAIVSALVVSPLREALGWFWLFASCSILGIFSLLYIAFYDLCFKTK
ncbi:hypothetical protein EGW08_011246 [Elysia chlorotica]|uniref:Major facilitator superfamily (MFS) profile domain-containing protein n=1 Tax=Elysia chlorotica TaxID=188477 RepID=A0A3S1A2H2_ELYCH|nr:hypothetical protein EGW08_011246 [Elysia chlorotica]